jgi:DNA modification methylase
MPSGIIQSVVTSPPYWGVRKYPGEQEITWADGSTVALGEEPVVEDYVNHLLEVLRHLKRVLRDDGTIWLNLGDTYQTRAYLRESSTERLVAVEGGRNDLWRDYPNKRYSSGHPYLKDKDLTLVPLLVALGAERIGFYVRSVIIWHKSNTMIETVTDRPTSSHEYILLLAKSRFYKYDKSRALETAVTGEVIKRNNGSREYEVVGERNLRTVWKFPTSSKHGDHTAAFPLELPTKCLQLSTDKGDLVFDPFAGSGTTLAAGKLLGCSYFGCDVMPEFVKEAKRRILAPRKPLSSKNSKRQTSAKSTGQVALLEKRRAYSKKKRSRSRV